jgi:flagellar motor switch protein FliG
MDQKERAAGAYRKIQGLLKEVELSEKNAPGDKRDPRAVDGSPAGAGPSEGDARGAGTQGTSGARGDGSARGDATPGAPGAPGTLGMPVFPDLSARLKDDGGTSSHDAARTGSSARDYRRPAPGPAPGHSPSYGTRGHGAPSHSSGHDPSHESPGQRDFPAPGDPHGGTASEKLRQVAMFLALIGREEAGGVLRRMNREEADRILEVMSHLPPISAQDARRVLARFGADSGGAGFSSHQALTGPETAREILIRAFGREAGERRFYEILPEERPRRFAFFEDVDGKQLSALLRKESNAVVSILVAHMPEKAAARLLNALEPERKVEVIRRISTLERVDGSILSVVEERLRKRVEALGTPEGEEIQGQERLAEILRYMDLGTGDRILTSLSEEDADLAEKVRTHLTTPDDLIYISNRDVQKVLQRVDDQDIAVLLKGKRDEVVGRITSNLSDRRREMVVMHRESLGPMRRRDVDRITTDFMRLVRTMAAEGEIVIRLPGEQYVDGSAQ